MRSTPRLPVRCRVDRCRKRGSRSASQAALGRNERRHAAEHTRTIPDGGQGPAGKWPRAAGWPPPQWVLCRFSGRRDRRRRAEPWRNRHPPRAPCRRTDGCRPRPGGSRVAGGFGRCHQPTCNRRGRLLTGDQSGGSMSNDGAQDDEKLLTKGEVAQLCRVEIRTVDRWVAARKITCYRIPSGRLLFRKRDVLLTADRRSERVAENGR